MAGFLQGLPNQGMWNDQRIETFFLPPSYIRRIVRSCIKRRYQYDTHMNITNSTSRRRHADATLVPRNAVEHSKWPLLSCFNFCRADSSPTQNCLVSRPCRYARQCNWASRKHRSQLVSPSSQSLLSRLDFRMGSMGN